MKYLITGGCGFVGSNLASEVLKRGGDLFIFDNLSRTGSSMNLEWLFSIGSFEFHYGDIRNKNDIEQAIKKIQPDVVFHLAGQVAMTTSLENPNLDFETNVVGSYNILESALSSNKYPIYLIYDTYGRVNRIRKTLLQVF